MNVSWREEFAELKAADQKAPLDAEGLVRLATAAMLAGEETQFAALLQRAHNAFLNERKPEQAARAAINLAMFQLNAGQAAQAGGWISRANRLLDDGRRDCVESGYLQIPLALQRLRAGDHARADGSFARAVEMGSASATPTCWRWVAWARGPH